jgi:hypothetical protein
MNTTKSMGLILLAIIGLIVIATVVAWLLGADPLAPGNWSGRANGAIGPWRTVLMLVRWAVWGLVWWRWEPMGQRLFRGNTEVATAQRRQWASMRKRMMGGIAVVELIILLSTITGE